MARTIPSVLVFLGALLVTLGLLAVFWIGPRARQAPIDQQSATVATGEGTYWNFEAQEQVESTSIRSMTNTESDRSVYEGPNAISEAIGVYDQTGGLFDDDTGTVITYSGPSRYAIDRSTALSVEDPAACCGADEVRGLTIKWPFGVEQEGDYEVWDGTLGDAAPATFEGVESIDGLEVYRFGVAIPPTDVGPVGEDAEFPRVNYEATKTYWVEPVTGRIIDSAQDVHQWITDEAGDTVIDAADVSLAVDDATRAANVEIGKDQTGQLALLDLVSWLGPLLGIVLLALGVWSWSRLAAPGRQAGAVDLSA